jgi:RHS repeat-associated protein
MHTTCATTLSGNLYTYKTYTFDVLESHLSAMYTYQPFNRLTSTSAATFSYDNNGNLTSKTEGLQTTQYVWDFENRLSRVSSLGSQDVWYKYDALGRRIERNKGVALPIPLATETTRLVYDGADVVRDRDANGATIADYLNGPGIDNKFRQTVSGTASYFVTDHLSTTRGLSDASGNVTSSLTYDSFGNVVSGSASTRYTYTGREFDSDTGLMYYRERWYDPQQGRFVSEDPIGLDGGINLFAYVANNPVDATDPLGLKKRKSNRTSRGPRPSRSCDCETKEDDSFLTLMSSYGIGVSKGFVGAAIGTAQLPIDLVNDPGGTVDGILVDIGMRIWTLGQIAAHPVVGFDAIVDSITTLGANKTMDLLGNAGGQVIFFESMAKVTEAARYGREFEIGENCKIAPFGNRAGDPIGRWPHYHRRVPNPNRPGEGMPGQGLKRHRPWERKSPDKSWRDRF